MKRTGISISRLFLAALVMSLLGACVAVPEPTTIGNETSSSSDTFVIVVEPIGHWHVFRPKKLLFTVLEAESDEEKVKLVFEIMRGIPEGDDINWEQPWRNTLNHITDAENLVVLIESEDGTVSDEVEPVYKGKGVYVAERLFSVAEVGEGMDYNVRFTFTDPYNGANVTHSEAYPLHAVPPH